MYAIRVFHKENRRGAPAHEYETTTGLIVYNLRASVFVHRICRAPADLPLL
jgi:hypothetical protein